MEYFAASCTLCISQIFFMEYMLVTYWDHQDSVANVLHHQLMCFSRDGLCKKYMFWKTKDLKAHRACNFTGIFFFKNEIIKLSSGDQNVAHLSKE